MAEPVPSAEPAPHGAHALGLRERKKRQTRQALRSNALRLVAEHGLDAVSVEDIAAAADVSKRTFFNYFETKEAAIVDFTPEQLSMFETVLAQRPPGEPPIESLRAIMMQLIGAQAEELASELEQQRRRLIQADPALSHRQLTVFGAVERIIIRWVNERFRIDPTSSLYPAVLAGASSAAVGAAFMRWDPATGVPRLLDLLNEAYDVLAASLVPPQGWRI
ncbi:TetR family transcriptional regulator [Planosporangium flavigriseum]|uniref:TetR family transcriptional regulator n=1 Tax=Planosporangium flavigriseum TaxID=373681 RepID=A0A8J3LJJ9_9ACTN|nr:TetR/AcrR family transcriptional regulator [Planosporangium flavigriseum]NJC65229.1 TetR family transcriptional regulator [Planosporangium flavigriseum]GIG71848.1 TetR family transcriptional regulator [Planosporangium flavigriseum]